VELQKYSSALASGGTFSIKEIAEHINNIDWEGRTTRFLAELPRADELGRRAGERAVARLGSRKIESCKAAVIFENRIAGSMVSPMLGAISGAAIARGVSFRDGVRVRSAEGRVDARGGREVGRQAADARTGTGDQRDAPGWQHRIGRCHRQSPRFAGGSQAQVTVMLPLSAR
jgi:hypothetical protein